MTKVNIISIRQWELEVKTAKLLEAQENTSSKIAIGCSFASLVEKVTRVLWTNHKIEVK